MFSPFCTIPEILTASSDADEQMDNTLHAPLAVMNTECLKVEDGLLVAPSWPDLSWSQPALAIYVLTLSAGLVQLRLCVEQENGRPVYGLHVDLSPRFAVALRTSAGVTLEVALTQLLQLWPCFPAGAPLTASMALAASATRPPPPLPPLVCSRLYRQVTGDTNRLPLTSAQRDALAWMQRLERQRGMCQRFATCFPVPGSRLVFSKTRGFVTKGSDERQSAIVTAGLLGGARATGKTVVVAALVSAAPPAVRDVTYPPTPWNHESCAQGTLIVTATHLISQWAGTLRLAGLSVEILDTPDAAHAWRRSVDVQTQTPTQTQTQTQTQTPHIVLVSLDALNVEARLQREAFSSDLEYRARRRRGCIEPSLTVVQWERVVLDELGFRVVQLHRYFTARVKWVLQGGLNRCGVRTILSDLYQSVRLSPAFITAVVYTALPPLILPRLETDHVFLHAPSGGRLLTHDWRAPSVDITTHPLVTVCRSSEEVLSARAECIRRRAAANYGEDIEGSEEDVTVVQEESEEGGGDDEEPGQWDYDELEWFEPLIPMFSRMFDQLTNPNGGGEEGEHEEEGEEEGEEGEEEGEHEEGEHEEAETGAEAGAEAEVEVEAAGVQAEAEAEPKVDVQLEYFTSQLEALVREDEEASACIICLHNHCDVITVCGHILCLKCALRVQTSQARAWLCPQCRTPARNGDLLHLQKTPAKSAVETWLLGRLEMLEMVEPGVTGVMLVVAASEQDATLLRHRLPPSPRLLISVSTELVGLVLTNVDSVVLYGKTDVPPAGVTNPRNVVYVTRLWE